MAKEKQYQYKSDWVTKKQKMIFALRDKLDKQQEFWIEDWIAYCNWNFQSSEELSLDILESAQRLGYCIVWDLPLYKGQRKLNCKVNSLIFGERAKRETDILFQQAEKEDNKASFKVLDELKRDLAEAKANEEKEKN